MTAARRLLMDVRPLRESPAFARLLAGSTLSAVGSQMTSFAVALQIYTVTRSSVAVGAVGLATAGPAIAFGLLGGSVVDAVDRRKLVLASSTCLAVLSAVLALQAFAELTVIWQLYLLVALQSVLRSVNSPAQRTFLPRLLPAERVPAGVALYTFAFHGSAIAGPALAGLVAAAWGLKVCYLIDALSFAAALYAIARLPSMPPEGGGTRPGPRAAADSLRFIRGNRVLAGAFLSDMSAMVLGMPIALFPAINAERFGGAPQTLGLLGAALSVGGVIGSALSGPVATVARQGRAMLLAGGVWGLALTGFGLARSLWLAFALLVVAGVADVLSVVFRTTIVQLATPDAHRGRISAAEYVVGAGLPHLGHFRAGAIGSLTSSTISAVSGGIATVAGAVVIGLTIPALVRYRARSGPVEAAETTA